MTDHQNVLNALYKRLIKFYPRGFWEQLGESMEQTFIDQYNETHKNQSSTFTFALWTFTETAIGIFREHLLLISQGDLMQALLKTTSVSALISLLLIFPLIIMEVVNRRSFNEEFPTVLFFAMWLNLFAVILILLPIMRGRWIENPDVAQPVSTQGSSLLTNPKSAALISVVLILSPGILPLLDYMGWLSLDRLFNGPNPEVDYLPGMILNILIISIPIVAGVIAGAPIARTLRARGSLFAHPINLIIVAFIVSTFALGLTTLIIDQWPCFIGVPVCD